MRCFQGQDPRGNGDNTQEPTTNHEQYTGEFRKVKSEGTHPESDGERDGDDRRGEMPAAEGMTERQNTLQGHQLVEVKPTESHGEEEKHYVEMAIFHYVKVNGHQKGQQKKLHGITKEEDEDKGGDCILFLDQTQTQPSYSPDQSQESNTHSRQEE